MRSKEVRCVTMATWKEPMQPDDVSVPCLLLRPATPGSPKVSAKITVVGETIRGACATDSIIHDFSVSSFGSEGEERKRLE